MNIHVGNVPYAATETDLVELFQKYGMVVTATIIRDRYDGRSKGFGFVEMKNQEDGERAIEALNGQEMMKRPLKVSLARSPSRPRNNNKVKTDSPEISFQGGKEKTQPGEKKTHLILTVGTNALPVWVAWYHLKEHLNNPKVGFLYTDETEKAMKCLKKYCKDASFFDISKVPNAGNPQNVRTTVESVLNNQLSDKSIHVHYTGGTQVMGVETVSAIAVKSSSNFDRSYLDARSSSVPSIRCKESCWGVPDARDGIDPDLNRIANLNGFKVCESEKLKENNTTKVKLAVGLIAAKNFQKIKSEFRGSGFNPFNNQQDNCWEQILKNTNETKQTWSQILAELNKAYSFVNGSPGDITEIRQFFTQNNRWLQFAVLAAFRDALEKINKDHYAIFYNVKVQQNEPNGVDFTLNVVVVLGYQVIVVSCSTTSEEKNVKMGAIKAYHQAKQLGGDEARVVMLCNLKKNRAEEVQAELHDDIGSEDNPIQVWGNDTWDQLTCNVANYLQNDLGWSSPSAESMERPNGHEVQNSVSSSTQSTQLGTQSNTETRLSRGKEGKNYLILTVGTNALPIWVAWYHLKEYLNNPKVGFVYTKETKNAMECLRNDHCTGQAFFDIPETLPGNPKRVVNAIEAVVNKLPANAPIHVHYTGGTQVMGVETVSAIAEKRTSNFDCSYLDARSGSGPTIQHRENSKRIDPADARQGISPDIHRIADLNGFQVRNFWIKHENRCYDGPQKFERDTLKKSEEAKLEIAQIILSNNNNNVFSDTRNSLVKTLSQDEKPLNRDCSTNLPEQACNIWKDEILPKFNTAYSKCQWCLHTWTLCPPVPNDTEAWKRDCKDMRTFLEGIWLEYVALDAFAKRLQKIKCTRKDNGHDYIRDNYALYRGVYVRRKVNDSDTSSENEQSSSNRSPKYFELDVVTVLGYQVVVTSCATTTNEREVKIKATEAYLRAKQLGGDEARVIMLCNLTDAEAQSLENQLQDDTGSKDVPLQVWGKETWFNLSNKFSEYLKGLGWE